MPALRPLSALIVVCLVASRGVEAQREQAAKGPHFAIGDTREMVRRVQSPPRVIERLASLGVEIWTWSSASVRFSSATQRVIAWQDGERELRARASGGGPASSAPHLALGTGASDVLRLLGQPRAATLADGTERWSYSTGTVVLDPEQRVVVGWVDPNRRLPVVESDRAIAERQAPRPGDAVPATLPGDRGIPHLALTLTLKDTAIASRSAGAANIAIVTISNAGTGSAYSIEPYVLVAPVGGAPANVLWAPTIPSLAPGATATREVAMRFPPSLLSDRVTLIGGATELNRHGVSPEVRVELPVVPSRTPRLAPVVIEQEDQSGDGRVSPREVVDVLVRLANVGGGDAVGAWATLSLGRDVFAIAGTPPRFELPRVRAGDSADVHFSVYTNARADSIGVRLIVRDARGRELVGVSVPLRVTGRGPADFETGAPTTSGGGTRNGSDVDAPLPGRVTTNPDALAVIFGIDYYRTLPRARFAARDAGTMRGYATALFGVPNDADHVLMRLDGDATHAEFRKAFAPTGWLARRVTPQSDVVVYFAGHGATDSDRNPVILPYDTDANYARETAMQLTELYDALAKLKARRVIVILDACFTGVSRGGVSLVTGARPITISIEHPALLRDGMAVFAAAQGAQIANDLPEQRHGLFSYHLFRGLRGAADTDHDGAITVDELGAFVAREVRAGAARRDREQQPLTIARERSLVVSRVPAPPAR